MNPKAKYFKDYADILQNNIFFDENIQGYIKLGKIRSNKDILIYITFLLSHNMLLRGKKFTPK